MLLSCYVDEFEAGRENVYAQLNKSVFLAGESLWFKVYVTDMKSGILEFRTNKIYTDLYAPDGTLYARKAWFVQDGCAHGQMNLPDTIPSGTYTFKAYTNWQRNFESERMFTAQITIEGFLLDDLPDFAPVNSPWDIRFFPEGGDLIAGTEARIGVKICGPDGKGAKLHGAVFSSQADTLLTFETNHLGMGRFTLPFTYTALDGLYARVQLPSGLSQKIALPKPLQMGISLQVNALAKERVDILLNTNQHSLIALANSPFYCMIHQNGVVGEIYKINSLEKTLTKLQASKEQLPAGVNTITLFDHSFLPVSERVIFVEKDLAHGSLSIHAVRISDSVEVRLKTTDYLGNKLPGLLSASVLPADTRAGVFDSDIYAQFFLAAEVRGEVESPAYYFQEQSAERLLALDNLMLTQAWRKYDWSAMLHQRERHYPYVFEYGFELAGKVLKQHTIADRGAPKSEVALYVSAPPFETRYADIAADGSFTFDSLMVFEPNNQAFLIAMDTKGNVNRRLQNVRTVSPIPETKIRQRTSSASAFSELDDKSWLQFIQPGATLLPASFVSARRPSAKDILSGDIYTSSNDRFYEITEENIAFFQSPIDVLTSIFGLEFKRGEGFAPEIKMRKRTASLSAAIANEESPPPALVIDGILVQDWSVIDHLSIYDIQAISVHPGINVLIGELGHYGSVHIKTRTKSLYRSSDHLKNFFNIIIDGYAASAQYYTPSYSNVVNKTHLSRYMSLHWAPNLTTEEGVCSFRFYAPFPVESIYIRTEGIALEGILFSREEIVYIM